MSLINHYKNSALSSDKLAIIVGMLLFLFSMKSNAQCISFNGLSDGQSFTQFTDIGLEGIVDNSIDANSVNVNLIINGTYIRSEFNTPFTWGNLTEVVANQENDFSTLICGVNEIELHIVTKNENAFVCGNSVNIELLCSDCLSIVAPAENRTYTFGEDIGVEVTTNTTLNTSVLVVDLYLDGDFLRTETDGPYLWGNPNVGTLSGSTEGELSFLPCGNHTLEATLRNEITNEEICSVTRNFSIACLTNCIEFFQPTENQSYLPGNAIDVEVITPSTPDSPFISAELYVDGVFLRTENDAPYLWGEPNIGADSGATSGELANLSCGNHVLRTILRNNITNDVLCISERNIFIDCQNCIEFIAPIDGQVYSFDEEVALEAVVLDQYNNEDYSVDLYYDGVFFRNEQLSPYIWGNPNIGPDSAGSDGELTNLSCGDHVFEAVIIEDDTGQTVCSVVTNITIECSSCVDFVAPLQNQYFNENEAIGVEAVLVSNNAANLNTAMDLYVDGVFLRTENAAPYLWGEPTIGNGSGATTGELANLSCGNHNLEIILRNTDTNEALCTVSRDIAVLCDDCITISQPIDGAYILENENVGVEVILANYVLEDTVDVDLFLNGVFVRKEQLSPFEWGSLNNLSINQQSDFQNIICGENEIVVQLADNLGNYVCNDTVVITKLCDDCFSFPFPSDGQVFNNISDIGAEISIANYIDDDAVSAILYLNGDSVRLDNTSPYRWGVLHPFNVFANTDFQNAVCGSNEILVELIDDTNNEVLCTEVINFNLICDDCIDFVQPQVNQTYLFNELPDVEISIADYIDQNTIDAAFYINRNFVRTEEVPPFNWGVSNTDSPNPNADFETLECGLNELIVNIVDQNDGSFICSDTIEVNLDCNSCLIAPCDDNDPCTINDTYDVDCNCIGTFEDTDNDTVCNAQDICEGFNDFSDSDLDGVPDGCDNLFNIDEGCYFLQFKHSGKYVSAEDGAGIEGNVTQSDFFGGDDEKFTFQLNADGDAYFIYSSNSDYGLEVESSGIANGDNINVFFINEDADHHKWILEDAGNGYFRIKNFNSGLYVDVSNISQEQDANVHQWESAGDNQLISLIPCSSSPPIADVDNDGIPDNIDDTFGDCTLGTPCDDGNDCTINDQLNDFCICVGAFQDQNNDNICDGYDVNELDNDCIYFLDLYDGQIFSENEFQGLEVDINPNINYRSIDLELYLNGSFIRKETARRYFWGNLSLPTFSDDIDVVDPNELDGLTCGLNTFEVVIVREGDNSEVCRSTLDIIVNCSDSTDECEILINAGLDICSAINNDADHPYASLNCSGNDFTNFEECDAGSDPTNNADDCLIFNNNSLDVCEYINNNPSTYIEGLDCDDDGFDNALECECGGNYIDTDGDNICDFLDETNGDCTLAGPCDDNDPCTINDIYDANCNCIGTFEDSDGDMICDAEDDTNGDCSLSGPCDDNDPCTINDIYDVDCNCIGTFEDTDLDGLCDANDPTNGACFLSGTCDDGDACTVNDGYDENCNCVGVFQDTDGDMICDAEDTTNGDCSLSGPCDDNDPCTINDLYNADCECAGQFEDSDADGICDFEDNTFGDCTLNGPCDDGDPCTVNDIYNETCNCDGTFVDTDNDTICDAEDTTNGDCILNEACDDGNIFTINDRFDNNCNCAGTLADDLCLEVLQAGNFEICIFLDANPDHPIANADCDGGGITNLIECQNYGDPIDINDDCYSALNANLDICSIIDNDPLHPLASSDCDNAGIDNQTECNFGTSPFDYWDDCFSAISSGIDVCTIINGNEDHPLAILDCDLGGIDNFSECLFGTSPNDPDDDCTAALNGNIDICLYVFVRPDSNFANSDCDGGGLSNYTECFSGGDPLDPSDDVSNPCDDTLTDISSICSQIADNPELAAADCDGDGVSNADECASLSDPTSTCTTPYISNIELCTYVLSNENSAIANLDCDGGGIINLEECRVVSDPFDSGDDCSAALQAGVDICALIASDENHPLINSDCDEGGLSNVLECIINNDLFDPADDATTPTSCTGLQPDQNICFEIDNNPAHPLADLDCDGGGVTNIIECQNFGDPSDNSDDCYAALNANLDICSIISNDPDHPLASADCDNAGIDNQTECEFGTSPFDYWDDCFSAIASGTDVCTIISGNEDHPLAILDCDLGGIDNYSECLFGTSPNDPSDDCDAALMGNIDICLYVFVRPDSNFAQSDCDGGGLSNYTECFSGGDPLDPSDDVSNPCDDTLTDINSICDAIADNPELAVADCDGDGISNEDECLALSDPTNTCTTSYISTIELCAYVLANESGALANLDCDNGGITNFEECTLLTDPFNSSDDCDAAELGNIDICALIAADENHPLTNVDCDDGGLSNVLECIIDNDPFDHSDDATTDDTSCLVLINDNEDICSIINNDPNHAYANLDCDGGGISNYIECQNNGNPSDESDDCLVALNADINVCELINGDANHPLANADCDNAGIDNLTECTFGSSPFDYWDDCFSAIASGANVCAIINGNPDHPLAILDCDLGGIDNFSECNLGTSPSNPLDDCTAAINGNLDICLYVFVRPDSNFAQSDCDGGGLSNYVECFSGGNPLDPSDDITNPCDNTQTDINSICDEIANDPELAAADCDGDGISNEEECIALSDPTNTCTTSYISTLELCTYVLANENSALANLDCDAGGISNFEECTLLTNPFESSDDCTAAESGNIDICDLIAIDPNHPFTNADCDGGGLSNVLECIISNDPFDASDDSFNLSESCENLIADNEDICSIINNDPTHPYADLDCDGGGLSNYEECRNSSDPSDPNDDCFAAINGYIDICIIIDGNPNHPLADKDCDFGGITNYIECIEGTNPLEIWDDCISAISTNADICSIVGQNEELPIAFFDCDLGGVDNLTECNFGFSPNDPSDDCEAAIMADLDICSFVFLNPLGDFALSDCDGGGLSNIVECLSGGDPSDPSDDATNPCDGTFESAEDICSQIANDPELAAADCDGDGVSNEEECIQGTDPTLTCDVEFPSPEDLCAFLAENPDGALANFDCDANGITNIVECSVSTNPFDPVDDCEAAQAAGINTCLLIALNPDHPLASDDCDNGGILNFQECLLGTDLYNPNDDLLFDEDEEDDCTLAAEFGIDICFTINNDENHPLASLDCDGGGIDNYTECKHHSNPSDPSDDCYATINGYLDICFIIDGDANHPLANEDCDSGGVDNYTECIYGTNPVELFDDCISAVDSNISICDIVNGNTELPIVYFDCDLGGIDNFNECKAGTQPKIPTDDCDAAILGNLDICSYVFLNPDGTFANADCDNGGVSNIIECYIGSNPSDPNDDQLNPCVNFYNSNTDICAAISNNPILAQADCDGDGLTNLEECTLGSDPLITCEAAYQNEADRCSFIIQNPESALANADCDGGGIINREECLANTNLFNPVDDCLAATELNVDICFLIFSNEGHPFTDLDCDNGGVSNYQECLTNTNPLDPSDDAGFEQDILPSTCEDLMIEGISICTFILANPNSNLALSDCDDGGMSNLEECQQGFDPSNFHDDCEAALAADIDFCSLIITEPSNHLVYKDCDDGGVDNYSECLFGSDPADALDDCVAVMNGFEEICVLVLNNPNGILAQSDCDNGGISNYEECLNGTNPAYLFDDLDNPCEELNNNTEDLCTLSSESIVFGNIDCDDDGIANVDECNAGTNPSDVCSHTYFNQAQLCNFVLNNPDSALALADCDGNGISNFDECQNNNGDTTDCFQFIENELSICEFILENPLSDLAQEDCDGGGVSNLLECINGFDPSVFNDDCEAALAGNVNICDILEADPDNLLTFQDCDNGGIDNITECSLGLDPSNPADDLQVLTCDDLYGNIDSLCIVVFVNIDLALADCDNDSFNNYEECIALSNPFDPCEHLFQNEEAFCNFLENSNDPDIVSLDCNGNSVTDLEECSEDNNDISGTDDISDENTDDSADISGTDDVSTIDDSSGDTTTGTEDGTTDLNEPAFTVCDSMNICTEAMTAIIICPEFCGDNIQITDVHSLYHCSVTEVSEQCFEYIPLPGMEMVGTDYIEFTGINENGDIYSLVVQAQIGNCNNDCVNEAINVCLNHMEPIVLCPEFCDFDEVADYSISSFSSLYSCSVYQLDDHCFRYVGLPGFFGIDGLEVTATGNNGAESIITYYIEVEENCESVEETVEDIDCVNNTVNSCTNPQTSITLCPEFCEFSSGNYSLINVQTSPNGNAVVINNNCFTYTPESLFSGNDNLTVFAKDNNDLLSSISYNISVHSNCNEASKLGTQDCEIQLPNLVNPNNEGLKLIGDYINDHSCLKEGENHLYIYNMLGQVIYENSKLETLSINNLLFNASGRYIYTLINTSNQEIYYGNILLVK